MFEIIIALVVLGFVVSVIAVVGHGLWVFLAFLARKLVDNPREPSDGREEAFQQCVYCGQMTRQSSARCDGCGKDLQRGNLPELADLEAVKRQLDRFGKLGTLDQATIGYLLARIEARRTELIEPPAEPKPVLPKPAEPKPVEPEPSEEIYALAEAVEEAPPEPEPTPTPKHKPAVVDWPASKPVREPQPAAALRSKPVPTPKPAKPAAAPRRSWAEMLAGFMEERNIRWGELIGGLLVVCSSAALVISLWDKLNTIPYFPFFIFVTVTSAIFGVGLYAHHRWRLESTSQGILTIAMLLVPLNLVAMVGMSQDQWTFVTLAAELVSLGIFAWLVGLAAQAIVPRGRWLAVLAVVGNSAVVLLTGRLTGLEDVGRQLAIGCLPVALFGTAMGLYLRRVSIPKLIKFDLPDVAALFTLLGTGGFALVTAHGLLIARASEVTGLATTLNCLSLPLALGSMSTLFAGLTVARRLAGRPELAIYRTAGTTVALVGMALMLAALGLAWPRPIAILTVGAVNCAALVFVAFRYRMPLAHAGAIACAAAVYLTGFHVFRGELDLVAPAQSNFDMLRLAVSAPSGTGLCAFFALLALVAEWLFRRGHARHALVYGVGCAVVAVASLSITNLHALNGLRGLHGGGIDALRAALLHAIYGLGGLWLAARWGRRELTYLGLGLLAAAALWAGWWQADRIGVTWALLAVLTHATLVVLAGLGFRAWAKRASPDNKKLGDELARVFIEPCDHVALISSTLAIPLWFAAMPWAAMVWLSACLFWLAAIWLVIACVRRMPGLLTGCQIVLVPAVCTAVAAWLEHQPWMANGQWLDPRCLQAHGVGLALLALAWMVARLAFRGNTVAQKLFEDARPAVDQIVLHAVTLGQFILIALHVLPECLNEVLPVRFAATTPVALHAFGSGAWLLLAIVAATMLASLWQRWDEVELTSCLLLLVTVPWLIAGRFVDDLAVGSALRWGLALSMILCSAVIWHRRRLRLICRRVGMRIRTGRQAPPLARGMIIVMAGLPVLALTVLAALVQIAGSTPHGPIVDSFFQSIGPNVSYLVPLILVAGGLVAFALREKSAGYAFSAGLVMEMIVTLGYALAVATDPDRSFNIAECVTLVQLGTIGAAVWAGLWLVARIRLNVWREGPDRQWARKLMSLQLAMGAAGNILLLVPALVCLAAYHPNWQDWTIAVGSPLGWIALVSVVAAAVFRQIQTGGHLAADVAGLLGMVALGLVACTVQAYWPDWGYRSLMLGWASFSLFIVAATWCVATFRTLPEGQQRELVRAAALWVRLAGILAVLLGLKAAMIYNEQLWAAAAIGLASLACATMSVWQRREGWALVAALGVNLAGSLVVWHFERPFNFDQWWCRLLEANIIASSVVALVWLAARRRLLRSREVSLSQNPLLAVQIALILTGIVALLSLPIVHLALSPQRLPDWMTKLADAPAWLALTLAVAAAGWFAVQLSPRNLPHAAFGLITGAAVLGICHTANFNGNAAWSDWLSYYVMLAALATAGLVVLLLGMIFAARSAARVWTTGIGAAVVVLSVFWCNVDPGSPWVSVWAIAAVAATAGILACWQRLPGYVFISGLLINVVGTVCWIAWGQPYTATQLVATNVLCLAIGSVVWSLVGFYYGSTTRNEAGTSRLFSVPFAHLAAEVAVVAICLGVALGIAIDLTEVGHVSIDWLGWIALLATVAALAVLVWDRSARFALPGLYCAGLSALGMAIILRDFSPRELHWTAAPEIAGYALTAACVGWVFSRARAIRRVLRIPNEQSRQPIGWFMSAQAVLVATAAVLGFWIALDFRFDPVGLDKALFGLSGRLSAIAVALMAVGASVVMAAHPTRTWRMQWQYAALGSGLMLQTFSGWAGVPDHLQAPWLARAVDLMVAAALMTLFSSLFLRRIVPAASDWIARGRQAIVVFGGLALVMLAVILAREGVLYGSTGSIPMALGDVIIVSVALAGLVVACLGLAVVPGADPFDLSERGRTVYVYLAEVLVVLACVHFRLCIPWLFHLGLIRRYWMFGMMAAAFVGAGLSEFFHRRRLPVLSEPLGKTALALPLLPAIGFWFAAQSTPAMWFLMALFYGTVAATRRSALLAVLAVLSTNMGLWVLWHRWEIQFLDHPQLWLIPIALAALVAEQLDRTRLADNQRTALRYLALSVIYVSSTADMFIAGIGHSWIMPLVLMLLAVAGVLVGMLIQVRSFLYLGVTFLVVNLLTMIRYAAFELNQKWILFASGIVLGLAIFALFAVFEKRRNDILAAVDRFKDWRR